MKNLRFKFVIFILIIASFSAGVYFISERMKKLENQVLRLNQSGEQKDVTLRILTDQAQAGQRGLEVIRKELDNTKEELEVTKRALDSVNKELSIANKELNIANSELQVANKVLEAANRQLEAANKKLENFTAQTYQKSSY